MRIICDMKYLKEFKVFESNSPEFSVDKGTYGWNCKFRNSVGKGKALLMDNNSTINIPIEMKGDELFLFGIDTTPSNKGIGKEFLNHIFDYFKLSKIYLPSDEDHPVWNKIATKENIPIEMGSKDSTIFSLTRNQLNSRSHNESLGTVDGEIANSDIEDTIEYIKNIFIDLDRDDLNIRVEYYFNPKLSPDSESIFLTISPENANLNFTMLEDKKVQLKDILLPLKSSINYMNSQGWEYTIFPGTTAISFKLEEFNQLSNGGDQCIYYMVRFDRKREE